MVDSAGHATDCRLVFYRANSHWSLYTYTTLFSIASNWAERSDRCGRSAKEPHVTRKASRKERGISVIGMFGYVLGCIALFLNLFVQ